MKNERTKKEIAADLREHLSDDGTLNDSTTDDFFREWHKIPEYGDEVDLETVEEWAVSVVLGCPRAKLN